ncbi:PREDICTED: cytochrome b561 domain-containing protein At2g30890-like isoform X1 [Camelina sativa]|uniref:Cytochrome b561 domain-containing protein At2g30890-like isoform X1 n=1 Tax=Camelina sativa TaxID=90675 RepID=A0ABM0Z4E6_CAMSA|nr:PREDICTED: cytochrome b561 domain-containing protein At2g30890-like isoform X1 [Camelina sativa]
MIIKAKLCILCFHFKPHEIMDIHHHLFFTLLLLLLPLSSAQENTRSLVIDVNGPVETSPISEQKLNPKLVYEIKVHGFMLWASMGVLMPIGIISIRLMSIKDQSSITLRRLFFLHVSSQMVAVILVTIGAIMSVKNFNNSFNNHHQRLGIGLYVIVWFQALLGFLRPPRGGKARRKWFLGHWISGTSIAILGIINIYTGLHAYTKKTSTSAKLWTILFTAQLSSIVLFYLVQDKWSYIQSQTTFNRNQSVDHNSNISAAENGHVEEVDEIKQSY